MEIKFLDNKKNGNVGEEIKKHLKKNSKLSVMSAYFTIYAFRELSKELKKIEEMRFIFTNPTFLENNKDTYREYYISKNSISGSEFEIKMKNELQQSNIARECATWIEKKAKMKSFKNQNMAPQRLVYIENDDNNVSINGTVDFSADGLGFTNSSRIDMNNCMIGNESSHTYLQQFNEIWEDESQVYDVKSNVLEQLETMYKENTPEFIYFLSLYNIFRDYLSDLSEDKIVKTKTGFKNTMIWNQLYKFQKDGVLGAIDKIEKYNGCVIADSVGLGKTFSALAVIKYYELRNDRVLVLAPKKLRDNWTIYSQNDKRNLFVDDRFNFDVLNHTDLSRYSGFSGDINLETVNWSNYDLIVIDESHNFRNNNSRKDRETRYSRLMNKVLKAGVKTKVLMLSATPVNNRMNDIKNQIAFITENNDKALIDEGINSIEQTLRKAQMVFNKWSKFNDELRTTETFVEMMNMDYFKLLDVITIARSRKHIEKYYDIKEIGKFPIRLKPINVYSDIDKDEKFPPMNYINKIIKNLSLCIYSPIKYVLPENRKEYSDLYDISVKSGGSIFKQADRERALVNLMRVNILKRMESSIHSFGMTISKILSRIDNTIEKIDQHQFDNNSEINISDIAEYDDEDLDDLLIGSKVRVLLQDMDLIKFKQKLQEDRESLEELLKEAAQITEKRDLKLLRLKSLIEEKIRNPINDNNNKVIIFTAFSDTAEYLYKEIYPWILEKFNLHSALVTGSGTNQTTLGEIKRKDLNSIITNFSPISKNRDKIFPEIKEEIDILIATDCISEGQNLQDCDYLINYDIHWNPVRIIQRFGRIDRLGSKNEKIQLVNFWANMELDEYINLENRVTGRMVLLDVSATGEENLISDNSKNKMNDLEYRKKQLKQLQEEVVDLEDISGGISITDLTMNDFKMDLLDYMKNNKVKLENAPLGMYAVASIEKIKDQIKPGVIFVLKQINNEIEPEEHNPLYPYYLVYVDEKGNVNYNYLHAKIILDILKKHCIGKGEIFVNLIDEFNHETNNGNQMDKYTSLLRIGIENIIGKSQEKGVESLFSKGGTVSKENLSSNLEDFELVSFLIIK